MDGLIDTAILIDIYRGYTPAVKWYNNNKQKVFAISPIVWMEAVEGAPNKIRQRQIIQLVSAFRMEYLTTSDQQWAMQQLLKFKLSHNVGMMDALIAAPAFRLQLPLYTRNMKHFIPLIPQLVNEPY